MLALSDPPAAEAVKNNSVEVAGPVSSDEAMPVTSDSQAAEAVKQGSGEGTGPVPVVGTMPAPSESSAAEAFSVFSPRIVQWVVP
jgi:hypothetical protein